MKRFSLILASLVLLIGTKASAFKGGPFDNGDYSSLLDNSGVYQVSMRFSNGSGFAQFGNNVDIALFVDINNTAGTGIRGSTYSVLNRSLIYYKGVTYLGTCMGMVDHERRIVEGVTNGNSDVGTTQVTSGTGGTGSGLTAATTTLNNNGSLNFPANSSFICKIHTTHPVLKFNGKGELSIVNPTLAQNVFNAIATEIASQLTANPVPNPGPNSPAQIQAFITALANLANGGQGSIRTAENVGANADTVPMKVFGSRVFFVQRR
jgi:hypothetical protein